MTTERVNPFGDLDDFAAVPANAKIGHLDVANEVAIANGFTSRQPGKLVMPAAPSPTAAASASQDKLANKKEVLPSRRRTTGRSEQVNIKTTFAAKKRLMEISVERDIPLGEVLELALIALEKSWIEDT
jgi:hypothetical protein